MPPVRIEFTVPQETYERIEQARGLVPRATWIKALIEAELARDEFSGPVDGKTLPSGGTWKRRDDGA